MTIQKIMNFRARAWRIIGAPLLHTVRTLRHPEVLERPSGADGVFTFDVAAHGRD